MKSAEYGFASLNAIRDFAAALNPGYGLFHPLARRFQEARGKRFQKNAWMPVCARPRISAWMSCVPS